MEPTLSRYVSLLLMLAGLSAAAPSRAAGENDPLNPPGDPIENSELLPATGFL